MSSALVTQLIKSRKGLLFAGKHVVAMLSPSPAAPGHVWVLPREAYPSLAQTPDHVVAELWVVANRLSMAIFEALGSQGTTLLVQDGAPAGQVLPHVILHLIPRSEDDGLPLLWEGRQLDEEAMSTVELKLKAEVRNIGIFEREAPKPMEAPKAEDITHEDPRVTHLRRIP